MAIVQRFFSTASAGAGDGTTWANRAQLHFGITWSAVITGFNFSGSDSLECFIGPGTYTIGSSLTTGLFANPPTEANRLFLCGCDSSGVLLPIPDSSWRSCQPAWDASTLPALTSSIDDYILQAAYTIAYLLNITSTNSSAGVVFQTDLIWCHVTNTRNSAGQAAVIFSGGSNRIVASCVLACNAAAYSVVLYINTSFPVVNTRIEGVTGSSGDRVGVFINTTATLIGCTIVNNGGRGVSGTSVLAELAHCVIANNGDTNVYLAGGLMLRQCMVTGGGGWGVDMASSGGLGVIEQTRLRDNASGNITGIGNFPSDLNNYTTDSDDATEYVSAGANGDFTIKFGSTIWGMGFGVLEECPSTPAASASVLWLGQTVVVGTGRDSMIASGTTGTSTGS